MSNLINKAPHYNKHPSGVEAIEICEHLNFCLGNAVKYVLRRNHKGSGGKVSKEDILQDLQKAEYYLKRQENHGKRLVKVGAGLVDILGEIIDSGCGDSEERFFRAIRSNISSFDAGYVLDARVASSMMLGFVSEMVNNIEMETKC